MDEVKSDTPFIKAAAGSFVTLFYILHMLQLGLGYIFTVFVKDKKCQSISRDEMKNIFVGNRLVASLKSHHMVIFGLRWIWESWKIEETPYLNAIKIPSTPSSKLKLSQGKE